MTPREPIVFISHNRVKNGKVQDLEAVVPDVAGRLEADKPGTLVFLAYLTDGSEMTVIHLFADAAAMEAHMEGAGERVQAANEFIETTGFEIYGRPSESVLAEMRQIDGSGVAVNLHSEYLGGFVRPRGR